MWKRVVAGLAAFLVLAVLVGLFAAVAPHYSTVLGWTLRAWLFWLAPVVVLGTAALGLWAVRESWYWDPSDWALFLGWGLVTLGAVAAGAWVLSGHGYLQARDYHTASVRVADDPAPAVGQRVPFGLAEEQAEVALGVPGEVTAFLPQRNAFATLAGSDGDGYGQVVEQDLPINGGTPATTSCRFTTDRILVDGGWWSRNLARAIHEVRRGVRYDSDDLYGYCDGTTPRVVIPLKRQVGWLVVTERPAGVALYDGRTGALEFRDAPRDVPGPAYPLSLARTQREALAAPDGYWNHLWGRSGYAATEEETVAGHTTDFVLPLAGRRDRPHFVTLLASRGSGQAITGIAHLDARARSGALAPLVVYRTDPFWVSQKAIESRVKADYADLPNWQNLRLMEVAPLDGDRWVVTLGNDQNVLYRVQGSGNLQGDQPTCLFRTNGERVRCGPEGGRGDPAGVPPGDLRGLSDAELADLHHRVGAEMERRLRDGD